MLNNWLAGFLAAFLPEEKTLTKPTAVHDGFNLVGNSIPQA